VASENAPIPNRAGSLSVAVGLSPLGGEEKVPARWTEKNPGMENKA